MENRAVQLTGYCGGFCGNCGISEFSIGSGIAALRGVTRAAAFRREAEHLGWPLMRDIASQSCAQFEGQVEAFEKLSRKLFPTCCRGGCVPCDIAACCKGKNQMTCAECAEMDTCAKLAETIRKKPTLRDDLRAIKAQGLQSWAEAKLRAAKAARRRLFTEAVDKALSGA